MNDPKPYTVKTCISRGPDTLVWELWVSTKAVAVGSPTFGSSKEAEEAGHKKVEEIVGARLPPRRAPNP